MMIQIMKQFQIKQLYTYGNSAIASSARILCARLAKNANSVEVDCTFRICVNRIFNALDVDTIRLG